MPERKAVLVDYVDDWRNTRENGSGKCYQDLTLCDLHGEEYWVYRPGMYKDYCPEHGTMVVLERIHKTVTGVNSSVDGTRYWKVVEDEEVSAHA